MSQSVEIYALLDELGEMRYVGKANNSARRLRSHLLDSRRRDTAVYRWIRKCSQRGFTPTVKVLEVCPTEEWPTRERYWIAQLRETCHLLNCADGGDEPFCPPETRRANGKNVASLRSQDPLRFQIYKLKRQIGQGLHRGDVSESTKNKLRVAVAKRPDLFGSLTKWL